MSRFDARDADALVRILARHYFAPRTKQRVIPPVTETVTRKRRIEEPVVEWREVDGGPAPEAVAFLVLANIVVLSLFFAWSALTVIALLVSVNAAGVAVMMKLRRKKLEEYTEIRTVEREVEEEVEVEPERVVEETVRSTRRVVALGRGAIGFRAAASDAGVLVTGPAEAAAAAELVFPMLDEAERVPHIDEELDSGLAVIPWVLAGPKQTFPLPEKIEDVDEIALRGLERDIRVHFDEVGELFSRVRPVSIHLEVVSDPTVLAALAPAADGPSQDAGIEELATWAGGEAGIPLERFAERWLARWKKIHHALFRARRLSLCDELAPECFDLGNRLLYTAFHFYCPECTRSEQQQLLGRDYSVHSQEVPEPVYFSKNARCVYQPSTETWRCQVCERETRHPIPMHKMLDELLLPAYDRLMEEHKVERLGAHERARSGELERRNDLEAELDKGRFEQLSAALALRDEMERFQADVAGEQGAIASMGEILGCYKLKSDQAMEKIHEFSTRAESRIGERTQEVLSKVDRIQQQEMTALAGELQELSRAKRLEDQRRDQIQLAILETNQEQLEVGKEHLEVGKEHLAVGRQQLDVSREHLEVSRHGFKNLESKIAQGNAIQAAVAKKSGTDIHDEAFWRIDKKLNHLGSDIVGRVTGRASHETEAAKLE